MDKVWAGVRRTLINFYPPLLGAGIQAKSIDERTIRVTMKLTPLNKNIVGVHFGGSLYSMCDPWFMLILMHSLGKDYIVWDKEANIKFLKPGRSHVSAIFHIPQDRINEIIQLAANHGKVEPTFTVDVVDEQAQVVARVEKLLYVRKIVL